MNKSSVNEPHPYHVEGMAEVMSSVANIFGKMGGTHEVHVHAANLTASQMFVATPPAFLSSPGATTTALLAQNLSNMSSQALHPAMQANSPYIYELDEYDCDVDLPVHVEDPGDDSI
jgi:formylmethanofuran dehydrogenase subunit A